MNCCLITLIEFQLPLKSCRKDTHTHTHIFSDNHKKKNEEKLFSKKTKRTKKTISKNCQNVSIVVLASLLAVHCIMSHMSNKGVKERSEESRMKFFATTGKILKVFVKQKMKH